jgi:hypothetical protein
MQAGDTHKMGVHGVDQHKPGMGKITGPPGGGEVFDINLRGKGIEPSYGFDKVLRGLYPPPPVPAQYKTGKPDPKGGKIQVHPYPPGGKGDFFVQGMIDPGNGDMSRKKGRLVLEKEKIINDGFNTPQGGTPQGRIT